MPDVAEVASIGGMVRQYQVVLDPDRMRQLGASRMAWLSRRWARANQASGRFRVEMAETEYMVRARGFLKSLDDFRTIPLKVAGRRRYCCATSPSSRSAPRCAAASPNWTARARSRAASW